MIKLKDLLTEMVGDWEGDGPAWSGKTYEFMEKYMIPLSPPVIKKVLGDIKVFVFHATDIDGVKKLKSLSGKSKSISTFKGLGDDSPMFLGFGIQNDGGIIIQVEGTLLANSATDISTQPDESGRRWMELDTFADIYEIYINDLSEKKLFKLFYKTPSIKNMMKWWWSLPGKKGDVPTEESVFNIMGAYINEKGKKYKASFIKDYMDMIEKEVWKKNATQIRKSFGKNLGDLVDPQGLYLASEWNELVVNKIKLKDAFIVFNSEGNWSEEDYDKAEKVLKSSITGKIEWGESNRDTEAWIKKRGGTVYGVDY